MSYLWIPLATKRITIAQCVPLYENIAAVMNRWENRFIAQPRRLVIINAVILAMIVYWSRTFVLPTKLISMIRTAIIKFLWSGSVHAKRIVPNSIQKVGKIKERKGFGNT